MTYNFVCGAEFALFNVYINVSCILVVLSVQTWIIVTMVKSSCYE